MVGEEWRGKPRDEKEKEGYRTGCLGYLRSQRNRSS